MTPIDKRKAELREYIEARKATVKIKLPGTSNEIDLRHAETIKSARIAEQLLECIEALEKAAEWYLGEDNYAQAADIAHEALKKIAGEK